MRSNTQPSDGGAGGVDTVLRAALAGEWHSVPTGKRAGYTSNSRFLLLGYDFDGVATSVSAACFSSPCETRES